MTKYSQMVCLVGENPLPIYLSIRQFAAHKATVKLVYSADTFEVAERIQIAIDEELKVEWDWIELESPHQPDKVGKKLQSAMSAGAILNYTGGTKVMAAFGVLAWKDHLADAFYLDESSAAFYFGQDATPVPLTATMTIKAICTLHSVAREEISSEKQEAINSLTLEDLRWIWSLMHTDAPSSEESRKQVEDRKDVDRYDNLAREYDKALRKWKPRMSRLIAVLNNEEQKRWHSISFPPSVEFYRGRRHYDTPFDPQMPLENEALKNRFRQARGWWMEMIISCFVDAAVTELKKGNPEKYAVTDIILNQRFSVYEGDYREAVFEKEKHFEGDLTAIIGHGLRYISSSVVSEKDWAKGKAFEAMHRAQQVGGGLAKSLTVTGLDADLTTLCNSDINASVPFASRRHSVLGRSDVDVWFKGNVDTLITFLQS